MLLTQTNVSFNHIRHATSIIEINNSKFLIDPMLSEKETLPPVILTKNKLKNPLVDLPVSIDHIFKHLDYIILTHLHFDHFDKTAVNKIPKTTPIICSGNDYKKLKTFGFSNCRVVNNDIELNGVKIKRYSAIHGTGILKFLLGKGSSFLIDYNGFKIFISGDCILNNSLKSNLTEVDPDIVIANGGAAKFKFGKSITMSIEDIKKIALTLKNAKIILVHLDALNHCSESGKFCKEQVQNISNIFIPNNGEIISLV